MTRTESEQEKVRKILKTGNKEEEEEETAVWPCGECFGTGTSADPWECCVTGWGFVCVYQAPEMGSTLGKKQPSDRKQRKTTKKNPKKARLNSKVPLYGIIFFFLPLSIECVCVCVRALFFFFVVFMLCLLPPPQKKIFTSTVLVVIHLSLAPSLSSCLFRYALLHVGFV